jgi:hypothetical protein
LPTYQEGGYSIQIDWSNYQRLVGEIAGVPDKLCELIAKDLERTLKKEAPKGITGEMRKSWRADRISQIAAVLGGLLNVVETRIGSIGSEWVVGNPVDYAAYVNDGTRPHVPPKAPIMEWAEFRGLPWFPVWRAICDRGTKANPYIDRSIEAVNGRIPLLFSEALAQMRGGGLAGAGFEDLEGFDL